jgi:hypothetical protein
MKYLYLPASPALLPLRPFFSLSSPHNWKRGLYFKGFGRHILHVEWSESTFRCPMSCADNFSYGRSIKQVFLYHEHALYWVCRSVSKNSVARWIVSLIKWVYQDTSKHLSTVRAHDTVTLQYIIPRICRIQGRREGLIKNNIYPPPKTSYSVFS